MITLILILGLILRLFSLNQSLWLDEATSALTTKMSLVDFFTKFMPGDFHPPLYYLALRVWAILFGTSEIALRSFSIILGVGTIYITYLIGKKLISKKAGIIGALLLATSGLHIYYSQEARMYVLDTFLVGLSIYFFTSLLQSYNEHIKIFHKSRVGEWLAFGLTLAAIGLTNYLPLLVLPVFWIVGFVTKQNFNWYKKLIASHIILLIFELIWFPVFLKQLISGLKVTNDSPAWVNVLGKFSIKDILLIPVKFAIGRVNFGNKFVYAFIVILFFALCFYLVTKSIKSIKNLKLLWLWLFVPLLIALLISIKIPVINYFRFLFLVPAFYLLIAAGITNLKKRWQECFLVLFLLLNLITSGMYLFSQKFQREDWRSAVSYIEHNKIANSIIIFPANSQMEVFHYYAPNEKLYSPKVLNSNPGEIWLIRYAVAISDPNDTTKLRIEGLGYRKVLELNFNGVGVWKYNKL